MSRVARLGWLVLIAATAWFYAALAGVLLHAAWLVWINRSDWFAAAWTALMALLTAAAGLWVIVRDHGPRGGGA